MNMFAFSILVVEKQRKTKRKFLRKNNFLILNCFLEYNGNILQRISFAKLVEYHFVIFYIFQGVYK